MLYMKTHLILTLTGSYSYYPHFIYEKTKAQRLNNLSKVLKVVTGRALIQTQAVGLQRELCALLSPYINLSLQLCNLSIKLGNLDNVLYKVHFSIGKSLLNSKHS